MWFVFQGLIIFGVFCWIGQYVDYLAEPGMKRAAGGIGGLIVVAERAPAVVLDVAPGIAFDLIGRAAQFVIADVQDAAVIASQRRHDFVDDEAAALSVGGGERREVLVRQIAQHAHGGAALADDQWRQNQRKAKAIRESAEVLRWCPGAESNDRHRDFQSPIQRGFFLVCVTDGSWKQAAPRGWPVHIPGGACQ
jgi:hypothetical protein